MQVQWQYSDSSFTHLSLASVSKTAQQRQAQYFSSHSCACSDLSLYTYVGKGLRFKNRLWMTHPHSTDSLPQQNPCNWLTFNYLHLLHGCLLQASQTTEINCGSPDHHILLEKFPSLIQITASCDYSTRDILIFFYDLTILLACRAARGLCQGSHVLEQWKKSCMLD